MRRRALFAAIIAGLLGLTKSVAADYVADGIRCNAICPGTVDTPSLHDRMAATGDYQVARAAFIARQPMGRLGRPEDTAAAALFLCSDDASYITGICLDVNGGIVMG
jgi:2-keto-3-deoxy-L-fuconate dehydrogenase